MKLLHLYLEGGPAPPMTSSICVFHLGISLVLAGLFMFQLGPGQVNQVFADGHEGGGAPPPPPPPPPSTAASSSTQR